MTQTVNLTLQSQDVAKDIHEAIANVYTLVEFVKKERAANLNYSFAGEAAIINAVRPAMVAQRIYMHVLNVCDVVRETYTTKNGTEMNRTNIRAVVRFTHGPSGTYIDCEALGEGTDAGDKSAPKAMTGAYKYAIRQTFCIETGDDPDQHSSEQQERATRPVEPEWTPSPIGDAPNCQNADCNKLTVWKYGKTRDGRRWNAWVCPDYKRKEDAEKHPPQYRKVEE